MRTHAQPARGHESRERDDRPLPSERMRQIRRMRRLHDLTGTEFIVLFALVTYDGPKGIRVRQRTIADAEGLHRQAVNRAISELQRKGALRVKKLKDHACRGYEIVYPEPRPVPDADTGVKQQADNPTPGGETLDGQGGETLAFHIGRSGVQDIQGTPKGGSVDSRERAREASPPPAEDADGDEPREHRSRATERQRAFIGSLSRELGEPEPADLGAWSWFRASQEIDALRERQRHRERPKGGPRRSSVGRMYDTLRRLREPEPALGVTS